MVYIKQKWRQAKVTDVGVKKIPTPLQNLTVRVWYAQGPHFPNNCTQAIKLLLMWLSRELTEYKKM